MRVIPEKSGPRRKEEFDCRRYIRTGDIIVALSEKTNELRMKPGAVKPTAQTQGRVISVYKKFIVIETHYITECVNRWDIVSVNGTWIGNDVGWLGRLKAV